jgi:hypothetical protein
MLRAPVEPPSQLVSIGEGAMRIDCEGLLELSRFQARDGTRLAYQLYPATRPGRRMAILAHGSAGSSAQRMALRVPTSGSRLSASISAATARRGRAARSATLADSTTTSRTS